MPAPVTITMTGDALARPPFVLLIDDAALRSAIAARLVMAGWPVTIAATPARADGQFGILITDRAGDDFPGPGLAMIDRRCPGHRGRAPVLLRHDHADELVGAIDAWIAAGASLALLRQLRGEDL